MSDMSNTYLKDTTEDSEEDNSDDNLKIVETPSPKRKAPLEPSKSKKLIIESIEDELEKRLEEKAAKTKLNAKLVKNIIKHVVTNEHVLALVKKAENPSAFKETIPYEPKPTRAKAKKLKSRIPILPVLRATSKPTSEVQVLSSEDLQEDASGDEYIPGKEESEDDRDSSVFSDPPSVSPATPPTPIPNTDPSIEANWSEDGVFKILSSKRKEYNEEEGNIVRRTKSKLCLSSTPLEVIEEAFIPSDIKTDMYDMNSDNDDWKDCFKKFTRPLDEIVKKEDEEQDPEYNILADVVIDKMDHEELIVDKDVKITRKELNDLKAELFDDADTCTTNDVDRSITKVDKSARNLDTEQSTANNQSQVLEITDTSKGAEQNAESLIVDINDSTVTGEDKCEDVTIRGTQIVLIEQQMRQHVQLLTQNFFLTYHHPELHHYSIQMKEYLLNLKLLSEGKTRSMFFTMNLNGALKLVEDWQTLLESDNEEVKEMKLHVKKTIVESTERKRCGYPYVVTFPKLLMETMSKSEVFLYPSLLPKIPFKSPKMFPKNLASYTDSEDYLIALGLEQFIPLARHDKINARTGEVTLKSVCSYIKECIMPHKGLYQIQRHVGLCKNSRTASNPIKYYFQNKKSPPVVHYVCTLSKQQILPPCKRLPNELPYQWKMFIYPSSNVPPEPPSVPVVILQPQVYNTPLDVQKILAPKGPTTSTVVHSSGNQQIIQIPKRRKVKRKQANIKKEKKVDPISKFVEYLSRPSQIQKLLSLYPSNSNVNDKREENKENRSLRISKQHESVLDTMLPSMPNLGTPVKSYLLNEVSSSTNPDAGKSQDKDISSSSNITTSSKGEGRRNTHVEFSTISSTSFQQADTSTEVEFCNPIDSVQTITTSNVNIVSDTNSQNVPSSSRLDLLPSSSNSHNEAHSELIQERQNGNIDKDNVDDINALMIASSTVKPAGRKEPSGAEKKRMKLKREFLGNLLVSTPEDPEVERQKNEMFALAYYDKMRETLELDDYHKVMQILNDHEEGDAVDLYKKIEKILRPKYQELANEFLLFLREKEAAAVDQLIPWIRMNNRSKFLRKVEIYFKDQPAQLRKIYKCLTELSQTVDVSMEKIKSTLLPMFKGNAVLNDLFLQNFLDERPPASLLEGPYEIIDISKEMSRPDDEEIYETITVPDVEDKYGGPSCICNCHQIEDPEFKSRYRHCIRCGTKFMNGKVYIQTGRGLRPATVSFLTSPNTDHNLRLLGKAPTTVGQRKKRSETSPSKQVTLSPTKENLDEESEDEVDGKKRTKKRPYKRKKPSERSSKGRKGPQKSSVAKKVSGKCDNIKFHSASPVQKEFKSGSRKRSYAVRKSKGRDNKKSENYDTEEKVTTKPGATPNQQKRLAEDSVEWEENAVADASSTDIKPSSPGHQTAESESEFCEESSQDNCESDSNSSVSSSNNQSQSDSNIGEESSWKREEDKVILETFQKENDKEHAFKIISEQLTNRTVSQISNRFQTLMTLLLETLGTP